MMVASVTGSETFQWLATRMDDVKLAQTSQNMGNIFYEIQLKF